MNSAEMGMCAFDLDRTGIGRHQTADRTYLELGIRLITLAQGAKRLFAGQPAHEQWRLLKFVLSNSTCRNEAVNAEGSLKSTAIRATKVQQNALALFHEVAREICAPIGLCLCLGSVDFS